MPAVVMVTKTGPQNYTPDELILGGQLVEGKDNSRVKVGTAGATRILGVALDDGNAPEAFVSEPTLVNGRPVLNAAPLPKIVSVTRGQEVPVKYSANTKFGEPLVATANGQVGPAGATPDARTIVGRCTAPAGVAAGAVGLAVIN